MMPLKQLTIFIKTRKPLVSDDFNEHRIVNFRLCSISVKHKHNFYCKAVLLTLICKEPILWLPCKFVGIHGLNKSMIYL